MEVINQPWISERVVTGFREGILSLPGLVERGGIGSVCTCFDRCNLPSIRTFSYRCPLISSYKWSDPIVGARKATVGDEPFLGSTGISPILNICSRFGFSSDDLASVLDSHELLTWKAHVRTFTVSGSHCVDARPLQIRSDPGQLPRRWHGGGARERLVGRGYTPTRNLLRRWDGGGS